MIYNEMILSFPLFIDGIYKYQHTLSLLFSNSLFSKGHKRQVGLCHVLIGPTLLNASGLIMLGV